MAAITPVTIANMALSEVGAKPVSSLFPSDGTPSASMILTYYDLALEQALVAHKWNFAIKRVSNQAARATPPAWGYQYAYTYPTNCLRVLAIGKQGYTVQDRWEVEVADENDDRIIVTDLQAPIDIQYIYRVTNSQVFSPNFVLAFSKLLKSYIARQITGKTEAKQEAIAEFKEAITMSRSIDGQEGTTQDYTPGDLEGVR
jgi:hypothetical protein